MKRALEPDFDTQLQALPERSRTLLAKVNIKYVRAMKLAGRFMQHVEDLYQNKAFYQSSDSCHMRLENPPLLFDWINVGLDKDTYVILGSTSGLVTFFNYIGQEDGEEENEERKSPKIWHLTEAHRVHCHELLVDYFVKYPLSELVLETGGEDGQFQGGRMGPSTNWHWVQAARVRSEDSEEEEEGEADSVNPDAEEEDEAIVQARIEELSADPFRTNLYV